jgi:hypothetical protein
MIPSESVSAIFHASLVLLECITTETVPNKFNPLDSDGYFLSAINGLVGQAQTLSGNRPHDCFISESETGCQT